MADRRDTRRTRAVTRVVALAALVLVASGLALTVASTVSRDTSVRPAVTPFDVPSASTTPTAGSRSSTGGAVASDRRRAVVAGAPGVVVVPALGVRAPVDPIRVEAGALTPPDDPGRIGWWADGARPGARSGKAVLTGHTVNAGGGAFDDLETLTAGETVVVEATGGRVTYDVTSVRVLSRAQLAAQSAAIFRTGGPHRLVLITCEDWDGVAYRSNVVVEAAPRA